MELERQCGNIAPIVWFFSAGQGACIGRDSHRRCPRTPVKRGEVGGGGGGGLK